ncbi:MAG: LPS-assembly protein LptD [Armatimonadetes bacterium]|nr:LPS-assembly protein LptD [Armatimonadota bacterium]
MAGSRPSLLRGLCLALLLAGLAAAPAFAQEEIPVTLRAKSFRYDRVRKILTAAGDVVVTYQDVVIHADRLEANLETNDVRAEGAVVIEVARQKIRGATLDYNLTSRRGRLTQSAAEYTGPQVLGAVFVRAEVVEGTLGGATSARGAFCSTCEGSNPVAYLTARELAVFPNDKIVGRQVSVWLFGRRVFTWPYFVIFIQERRASRLLPVAGYSGAEGYFLKLFYSYAVNQNHYGYLRLDLMERLGIGYGIEHVYRLRGGEGQVFLYRLDNREIGGVDARAVLNHQQRLGDVQTRLYADYLSRTSPLAPSTDIYAALDTYYRGPRSTTTLFQTYASLDTSGVASSTYTARAIHVQQLSGTLTADVVADVQRSTTSLGTDEELLPRLTFRYRGRGYSASLVADGRVDLDGSGFPGDIRLGVERLPEMTAVTDPRVIRGTRLAYQLQGGLGRFRETQIAATVDAVRADAAVTLNGPLRQADGSVVHLRLQARGTAYSTGDVRALVSGRLDYFRQMTETWQAQVGLSYQDQSGRTPFLFDTISTRLAQADATLTHRRPNFVTTATASYDAAGGRWGPLVVRSQYAPRAGWWVAGAVSYDPSLGQVTRAELSSDVRLNANWQLTYYGFYDGGSGQVVHDRLTITRIWYDCLATAITYRGSTNEVWLESWLVALPWAKGQVGIGAQGNLLFIQPWLRPKP